jgi:hypothetical protein
MATRRPPFYDFVEILLAPGLDHGARDVIAGLLRTHGRAYGNLAILALLTLRYLVRRQVVALGSRGLCFGDILQCTQCR